MPWKFRVSLAQKCQLLFGAAVLLILVAALGVVAFRMQTLVRETQRDRARELADTWLTDVARFGKPRRSTETDLKHGILFQFVPAEELDGTSRYDDFLTEAAALFRAHASRDEMFRPMLLEGGQKSYRYARAVRLSDLEQPATQPATAPTTEDHLPDPLRAVLLIHLQPDLAQRQLQLNNIYIVLAGLFAFLVAIAVFWLITTRLILSPVRLLRHTAEKIAEGDLQARAQITTGDEFEHLSDVFNHMLENLKKSQDQLRSVNKSLDLKLGELAETNVSLYESNKMKGEFLANVSHELRTPLHSIIGFAEVLAESLKEAPTPDDEKRRRYLNNIVTSSRRLLDLINDLLDLAKIEAGRVDVQTAPMSIADTAEGLLNLMRPQAEKGSIELKLKVEPKLPPVVTDASKVQQILFNLLSNAVKFTPAGGSVTLGAALGKAGEPPNDKPTVHISVTDTGPGIPFDEHEKIFEKFTQLDQSVTKEHGGTGLGLTISRELANLLQGRIELDSDIGKGATFTLVLPLTLQTQSVPLMPNLAETAENRPQT